MACDAAIMYDWYIFHILKYIKIQGSWHDIDDARKTPIVKDPKDVLCVRKRKFVISRSGCKIYPTLRAFILPLIVVTR